MTKNTIMSGVLGLVVGLVIGFMFANNVNRSASSAPSVSAPAAQQGTRDQTSDSQGLPPDHPPLGTSSGSAPGRGGPQPQVAAAIEKAKADPQNFEAQMTAADLYYQIQRFDDASKFHEAAAKLKPSDTEPMIKAGNAYFDAEKYEQAEKWYVQALQKEPKNVSVRTDLGLTYFLREPRDIDSAIKNYKMSLEIDPNHEITLQNLVLAYTEKGDKADLDAALERLRKVNPNNPIFTRTAGDKQP